MTTVKINTRQEKGSRLTIPEMDENFTNLKAAVESAQTEAAASIQAASQAAAAASSAATSAETVAAEVAAAADSAIAASSSATAALAAADEASAGAAVAATSAAGASASAASASSAAASAGTKSAEAAASGVAAAASASDAASAAMAAVAAADETSANAASASSAAAAATTKAQEAAASAAVAEASAATATTKAQEAAASATALALAEASALGSAESAAASAASAGDSAALAVDWASKTDGPLPGGEFSAKKHAQDAAAAAASISGGPVTSVNGKTGVVDLAPEDVGAAAAEHGHSISDVSGLALALDGKQAALVSGENLKTINGESLLGSGNIVIAGGTGVTVSGNLSIYVTQSTTLTITNYDSATDYSVTAAGGTVSISGDQIAYTAGNTAGSYAINITAGAALRAVAVTVNAAAVSAPTITSPTNGATGIGQTPTITTAAFATIGVSDTHLNSDWEIRTATNGGGTLIASSLADATNKLSWTVPGNLLVVATTYYARVRHRGTTLGAGGWSEVSFTTAASFGGLIGTQGTQGFGVGIYLGALPSGFSAMTGTTDKTHANYGNYQYTDGSIMCFVPKFFYRIGHASSPRFATYGANAIDIVGIEAYASESAANAAGYALHRAFVDGGSEKSGFFVDKYLASKNGTTSCKSIANGNPISLTTSANYNPSNGMTGCTGILADAVVLARARGAGVFNVASAFIYSALALLALAHGQAATGTTNCAWYDAGGTTNFPKGCNNGALADTNDATVTFTTAGVSGDLKALTGSASNLAKTTHNGQACGVTDVNGAMYQVMLGITRPGTTATDTAVAATGDSYVLKRSVALASLTGGWNGANDAWGDSTNVATKYDLVAGLFPFGSTTGWTYFGNGTTQVFSGATSGTSYSRTACGIQDTTSGTSAAGTNQFGNDGCYQYNRANQFPYASGGWGGAAVAGVFCRGWDVYRSGGGSGAGFRCAAYGT